MNALSVRKVKPEEYKLLSSFGRETFYETWMEYNTESDMQLYLKEAFDEERILKDLKNSLVNTFLFAFDGENLVGYAKIRNDRTHLEFNGEKALEIERIYVLKSYQGMLTGKLLMDECLEMGKQGNYNWIWLGVNIDNHRAIAFYKKYDFITFGTKMFRLGDAEDQDYLMKRKL